jgi:hypothetical protein
MRVYAPSCLIYWTLLLAFSFVYATGFRGSASALPGAIDRQCDGTDEF